MITCFQDIKGADLGCPSYSIIAKLKLLQFVLYNNAAKYIYIVSIHPLHSLDSLMLAGFAMNVGTCPKHSI